MASSYNEFLRVMFTPVPQEPIVKENKWIQVSEPKWKEGTGFWKGHKVPVYEDGKYYRINGGIFKFIEHPDGSGYLEPDPQYWTRIKTGQPQGVRYTTTYA